MTGSERISELFQDRREAYPTLSVNSFACMSNAAESPAPNSESAPGADLETRLKEALAERDANMDRCLRAFAEFENYRRRSQKERDDERKFAPQDFMRDLLPVLDNLHRAVDAAKAGSSVTDLIKGVEMTLKMVDEALAKNGATAIPAVGQQFDPTRHAALTQIPTKEHPPMTVLQEVERGYLLHDRVLRPSRVIVAGEG